MKTSNTKAVQIIYTLTFKKAPDMVEQQVRRVCLTELIMQIKRDFETGAFKTLDQIVSVTYKDANKQKQSALICVLNQLKISANGVLRVEIVNRLNYLKNCC